MQSELYVNDLPYRSMHLSDDVKYKEMAYSMPPAQLKLLKSYAGSPNDQKTVDMCMLYYPKLSAIEAEKFMGWLKTQRI